MPLRALSRLRGLDAMAPQVSAVVPRGIYRADAIVYLPNERRR
jgi:hypothetical protein